MSPSHNYGAIKFASFGDFYGAQREAAEAIIRDIHGIAYGSWLSRHRAGEAQRNAARGGSGPLSDDYDRPHQTFTIDGPRGSGKTTLLQTLSGFLSLMRLDTDRITAVNEEEESTRNELRALGLSAPDGTGNRRTALVLPIVFTEDMDLLESTMEAVFAQLEHRIDEELLSRKEDRALLEALRNELRREVGVAWTFSQKIGAEALSQDALDYADFVERRAEHNKLAYTRIVTWRRFVDRYLDALGYELLVPLFDDSDLNANAAGDILRAIRMYFSHPRVAPILVAEVDNLSWAIFARELAAESKAIGAMRALDANETSSFLGNFVEKIDSNSDALLAKILPMNLRYELRPTDLRHIDHFFSRVECGLGDKAASFEDWCRRHHDAAEDPIDRFAWFFLAGPYRRLVGENVRAMITFRDATAHGGSKPLRSLLRAQSVRELGQKVSRDLAELDWLIESGAVSAGWNDDVREDDGIVDEVVFDAAAAHLVDLYLDIKIAEASLDVQGSAIVGQWLPIGLLGETAPREPADPDKRLGVAGYLRREPLPRSCLYVHQLRRLSGVAFRPLPQGSYWALWLGEGEVADDDERLDRVRAAAADVAKVAEGSDAGLLQWLKLRIRVLRDLDKTSSVQFERDAPAFIAALYATTRPPGRGRPNLVRALTSLSDPESDDDLGSFLDKLAEAVRKSERRRQEALFTWAAALELARSGDDQRVERPRPRSSLVVTLTATGARPRFTKLVDQTLSILKEGNRSALLLAWSIAPLLDPLHGFATDYDDLIESVPDWARLSEAFAALATSELSTPMTDSSWEYSDIPGNNLAEIRATVVEVTRRFGTDLNPSEAAGAPQGPSRKGGLPEPEALVAAVLGTSRRWARENLVS